MGAVHKEIRKAQTSAIETLGLEKLSQVASSAFDKTGIGEGIKKKQKMFMETEPGSGIHDLIQGIGKKQKMFEDIGEEIGVGIEKKKTMIEEDLEELTSPLGVSIDLGSGDQTETPSTSEEDPNVEQTIADEVALRKIRRRLRDRFGRRETRGGRAEMVGTGYSLGG